MIFRVYEHYDDNQTNYLNYDVCFICYDLRSDTENCPTSLKNQVVYYKSCNCDGWIHKQCLEMWYKKQKKCPICRIQITERPSNDVVVSVIPYTNKIYLFVCNSVNRMTRIFLYCFFLFAIIEFYLCIAVSKNLMSNTCKNNNNFPYSHLEFNNNTMFDND